MVSHLDSVWNRGSRELGNGLLFTSHCAKLTSYIVAQFRPTGSPRKPLAQSRRQPNKVSQRRSNNGKDMLRKRQGTLGSAVRRSQRLAGRRTPVGVSKINATARPWCSCLCLFEGRFFFFYLRVNLPEVRVTIKWRGYWHCIANFCATVLNVLLKEIISHNTKCQKEMLTFIWNTWKYWRNQTDDEI